MPYRYRVGQVVSAASAHAEPLHATFHESADPMILLDLDDRRVVDANEAFGRLVGYARGEVIGRHPYEHAVGGQPVAPLQSWREMARTLANCPGAVFGNRREMLHRDGSTTLVQWSYCGVTLAGRPLILVVGVPVEDEEPSPVLGKREREVVRLLALGKRMAEIAAEMCISEKTVETHTRNARLKLGAANRAELIAKALGNGLIS